MADSDVKVTSNLKTVISALQIQLKNGLWAIGSVAEGYAKDELYDGHGLDTGRLRNSITFATPEYAGESSYKDNAGNLYSDGGAHKTPNDISVYIGTNVEYAPYVENGTSKQAALHFLKNAAANHSDEYKKLLEDALKA